MLYKPVPNKDYTPAIAARDGKEIRRAMRNAKAFDWSKLEKIQAILQKKSTDRSPVCGI